MRSLNADVISQIEAKSLFSREEEDLLCTVTPVRTRHVLLLLKTFEGCVKSCRAYIVEGFIASKPTDRGDFCDTPAR